MKKAYVTATYSVVLFDIKADIVTISSDRENAYVPSDSIWKDLEFDDDN